MSGVINIPEDISLVVLDLDGTIYRKPKMAWYMLLKQWCHLPSLVAERRWRKAQRQALKDGSAMPPMPVSEQWYKQNYLPSMVQIIAEHYQPQEWLQPMMDECRKRNVPVVVLSDYEAAQQKLQVLGLDASMFASVLSTGDLGTIKPDVRLGDAVKSAINNAALQWRHVLFIGDRDDTDGLLAQQLGAQFVRV